MSGDGDHFPAIPMHQHSPLPVQDRSGRSQCYNCIIETFQTQAFNLARRMLDDWALAEDAVQVAWSPGTGLSTSSGAIISRPG